MNRKQLLRLFIALVFGGLVGTAAGFALGIFIYPFWFLNDVAEETLSHDVERSTLAAGTFIHVNTMDPVHYGKGTVELLTEAPARTLVHLQDDFEVGPGPRFHVYLVDHAAVRSGDDFLNSPKVDLGRLRAFRGSQIYDVPSNVDVAQYKSVVIWCKEFGVLISPASLVASDNAKDDGQKLSLRLPARS